MNDLTHPDAIDPPYLHPDYRSTRLRSPREPLFGLPRGALDAAGPLVPAGFVRDGDNDLTRHGKSPPLGEKMVLSGRLLDESGRPIARSLIEVWQANASGTTIPATRTTPRSIPISWAWAAPLPTTTAGIAS